MAACPKQDLSRLCYNEQDEALACERRGKAMAKKLNRIQDEREYGEEEQTIFNEYRNAFQTPVCSSLLLAPGLNNSELIQSAWLLVKSMTKEGSFTPTMVQMILFTTSVFGGNSYCINLHANVAIATDSHLNPDTLISLINDIAGNEKCNLPNKTIETIRLAVKVMFQDNSIDIHENLTEFGYSEADIDIFASIVTGGVFFNTIFKLYEVPEDALSTTPFSKNQLTQIKQIAGQYHEALASNSQSLSK